jgi:hypothetical protein
MGDEMPSQSRRALLGTGAAGAVGLAVGLAGGAFAAPSRTVAVIEHTNRPRFADKVVLITGATSGIGKAAAIQFAAGRKGCLLRSPPKSGPRSGTADPAGRRRSNLHPRADVRIEGDVKAVFGRKWD